MWGDDDANNTRCGICGSLLYWSCATALRARRAGSLVDEPGIGRRSTSRRLEGAMVRDNGRPERRTTSSSALAMRARELGRGVRRPLRGVVGRDDRRRAFYVELAREADGPLVELAVGNGRVAIPVAQATGRPVIGIDTSPAMLDLARARAAEAGVELDLREGDMRDLALDEPAALIYCPFRALLHLPTWADRRRTFERVAASLRPGGRFAWNAFAFDHQIAARLDGQHQDEPVPHTVRYARRRQPHRPHARRRRHELALVGDEERVARAHRCRGARARGALRRLRPASRSTTRAASTSSSRAALAAPTCRELRAQLVEGGLLFSLTACPCSLCALATADAAVSDERVVRGDLLRRRLRADQRRTASPMGFRPSSCSSCGDP